MAPKGSGFRFRGPFFLAILSNKSTLRGVGLSKG